ncbi:DUF11 domain-containing protein [Streptomyces bambusae]|uniref:DUF11 domain-containing protein n=1 Tax=Streptomyces bambusae TaxID=1550616 RepID=UPI001CFD6441|nr:DUF11 domain-containing protein [Streptomyces bambusae]MCB5163948.1 DUF11 domain-containing protein [Streptomyces bambusae]
MPPYSPRRRAGRACALSAASLALVLGLPGAAAAAPGDLDPGFDGDGKVLTSVTGYENVSDLAVQPDGKIITIGDGYFDETSGDFVLVRHNPDGTLDTTFGGGDGIVTTDFDTNNEEGRALALQPDGKIIAVGGSTSIAGNGTWAMVRYNHDGSVDTDFGDGGKVFTAFDPDVIQTADAVAVHSDGRIVVGGEHFGIWSVAAYTQDGTPDPTFDGDGKVTTDFGGGCCNAVSDLVIQSDGRIVAAGHSPAGITLARYNTNGSLDTGFDTDGKATPGFGSIARGVALDNVGRIVTAGHDGTAFGLARFTAAGALDPTFDGDGRVTTSFGPGTAAAADLDLQADGRIVAAGSYEGDFAVARYNATGSLDTGFGGDGRVTTDFKGPEDGATSVALDADGRILAGGVAGDGNILDNDRALARYLGGAGTAPPVADLSVTKTGTAAVSIGDRATYTVTVTNSASSTATATGVTLTDTLSGAGGTLLSASAGQGSCTVTATSATCNLGNLAVGASTTVTLTAEPRSVGTLTDTSTVTGSPQDPAPGNNTVSASTSVNNARGCTIIGTSNADTLTGGFGNDVVCGLSGNDTVRAGYGRDTVHGGPGNDNLDGGFGDDTLDGGPGNDILTGYYGNDRLTTTDGVTANDTANGGSGTDTCTTDPGDTRISCP